MAVNWASKGTSATSKLVCAQELHLPVNPFQTLLLAVSAGESAYTRKEARSKAQKTPEIADHTCRPKADDQDSLCGPEQHKL